MHVAGVFRYDTSTLKIRQFATAPGVFHGNLGKRPPVSHPVPMENARTRYQTLGHDHTWGKIRLHYSTYHLRNTTFLT